mmetsp:Transcript_16863/g.16523  ORF Transcript_16863/g.16523 Transcript_16863/m.16523 type:complete len:119 (+) Transcript_16863:7-363(+)
MSNKEWKFDLSKQRVENLHPPLGFKANVGDVSLKVDRRQGLTSKELEVLTTKSWQVAKSPFQSIFMTLFMFWMSGSSVSIWTLMITISFLFSPVSQLFNVSTVFEPYEGKIPLFLQKA